VIRRADGLSIAGPASALNDLAMGARNKQLKANDLSGATFTVNNSGHVRHALQRHRDNAVLGLWDNQRRSFCGKSSGWPFSR